MKRFSITLFLTISNQFSKAALLRRGNVNKQRQLAEELPCESAGSGIDVSVCTSSSECYSTCRVFDGVTGCDEKKSFIGLYPPICETSVESPSDSESTVGRQSDCIEIGSAIYIDALADAASNCDSSAACAPYGSCRLFTFSGSSYLACDSNNNFVAWPAVCEDIEVESGPASTSVSTPVSSGGGGGVTREEGCISGNDITSDIVNNPMTACTSNAACIGGLCRLISGENNWLACDEGKNFEGVGWPALCNDVPIRSPDNNSDMTIGINDNGNTDTDTDTESKSESTESESAESESSFDTSESESFESETSEYHDTDANDGDSNIPVRSDCVETGSENYIAARGNMLSTCSTSAECSVGVCRIVSGVENPWLFCDEGDHFGSLLGWLSVCNEIEVPVRQPGESDVCGGISDGGCVDLNSPACEDARNNVITQCTSSSDCNSGPCRLFAFANSSYFACDEGDNFVGLPEVCLFDF